MLRYLCAEWMMKDYCFGQAVNAVFELVRKFHKDEILERILDDSKKHFDTSSSFDELYCDTFCGNDLTFFLQQLHLIGFFRSSLTDKSIVFLEQVMIAHAVREVSNAEHCLSIQIDNDDPHGFLVTEKYKQDCVFLKNLFHRKRVPISRFIPFVACKVKKQVVLTKIKNRINDRDLRVFVLKRVHHQKIHQEMIHKIYTMKRNRKSKVQRASNVYCALKTIFDGNLNQHLKRFVQSVQTLSNANRTKNFQLISRTTAQLQNFSILLQIVDLMDAKFETALYRDFLMGSCFGELQNLQCVSDQLVSEHKYS
jgi:hypothetical protein